MKWILVLLCIFLLYSNIGYSQDKNSYLGTWEGESQFITTKITFKDNNKVEVYFSLQFRDIYLQRNGSWSVNKNKKTINLLLNYEETKDYELHIRSIKRWYKHKFVLIGNNKGILIDNNASTYIVYKTRDKNGHRIKRLKKKI